MYKGHIEFIKNGIETNPNTGESRNRTIIDVYFYDDRVDVWGWGWTNTIKSENEQKSIKQLWDYVLHHYTKCNGFDYYITKELQA